MQNAQSTNTRPDESRIAERKWLKSSSSLAQCIKTDYIGAYRGNIRLYHSRQPRHKLKIIIRAWLQNELTGFGMRWRKSEYQAAENITTNSQTMTAADSSGRVPGVMNPPACCVVFAEQILGPNAAYPLLCLTDGPANVLEIVMPKIAKQEQPPHQPEHDWHRLHLQDNSFVDWSKCLQMLQDNGHAERHESGDWHSVRDKVRAHLRENPSTIDPHWHMYGSLFRDIGKVLQRYREELDNPKSPAWLQRLKGEIVENGERVDESDANNARSLQNANLLERHRSQDANNGAGSNVNDEMEID